MTRQGSPRAGVSPRRLAHAGLDPEAGSGRQLRFFMVDYPAEIPTGPFERAEWRSGRLEKRCDTADQTPAGRDANVSKMAADRAFLHASST